MSRKRYRDQILGEILRICQKGGASKTRIVYCSNMNFKTVVPYMVLLIENELLEMKEGYPVRYQTTAKGLKALECLNALEELISEF
jgi:predicted transcriptional regulator